jgi:ATP-binding cassette, subfamily B, bacterial IrtA/YbtP
MCATDVKEVQPQQVNPLSFVLKPIQMPLFFASIIAALGSMLTLVPLIGIAYLVKAMFVGHSAMGIFNLDSSHVLWTLLGCLGCLLLGMLLITLSEFIAHLADHKITGILQKDITQHLTQLPLGWFTQRGSGEVKQVIQDDMGQLHSLTAHFYPAVGRALGIIITAVFFLFYIDWRMAILSLLPFIGFVFFLRKAIHASEQNIQDFATQMGQINSAAVEFTRAIPVVKTFAQSGQASMGYQQAVRTFAHAFKVFTRPLVKSMAHAHAMISPITILGVVMLSGAIFIYLGGLNPIDLLVFVLIAPAICAPTLLLHTLLHDLQASHGAAQRILGLLEKPILQVSPTAQSLALEDQTVCFHQVSYAYDQTHEVLSQLNFSLQPGTFTAIVGPSGAGKSTIAQLILRFFDPSQGHITLGGVDLRNIQPSMLYQQIGFVLQDTQLIHATLYDNIALGRSNATQQEVEQAAKAANIHDRIMRLPKQYQTMIGDEIQLSGGERQRISIARAILLDPPILILDEATAAADIENEMAIQNALSNFAQDRTLLVIAHRLDTIMHADRILVLNQGKIIEQGTHKQLLTNQGLYAQLWSHLDKHTQLSTGETLC